VGGTAGVNVAVTGTKAVGVRVLSTPPGVDVGPPAGGKGTQAVANNRGMYSNCKKALLFILVSS
jgi:hypothetical protein